MSQLTDPKFVSVFNHFITLLHRLKMLNNGWKSVILEIIHKFTLFCWRLKSKVGWKWKISKETSRLQLKMSENYKWKSRELLRHLRRSKRLIGMEELEFLLLSGKHFALKSICRFLELVSLKRQSLDVNQVQLNSQIATNRSSSSAGSRNVVNMLFQ